MPFTDFGSYRDVPAAANDKDTVRTSKLCGLGGQGDNTTASETQERFARNRRGIPILYIILGCN